MIKDLQFQPRVRMHSMLQTPPELAIRVAVHIQRVISKPSANCWNNRKWFAKIVAPLIELRFEDVFRLCSHLTHETGKATGSKKSSAATDMRLVLPYSRAIGRVAAVPWRRAFWTYRSATSSAVWLFAKLLPSEIQIVYQNDSEKLDSSVCETYITETAPMPLMRTQLLHLCAEDEKLVQELGKVCFLELTGCIYVSSLTEDSEIFFEVGSTKALAWEIRRTTSHHSNDEWGSTTRRVGGVGTFIMFLIPHQRVK